MAHLKMYLLHFSIELNDKADVHVYKLVSLRDR